jgi:hypothetical protein
MPSPGLNYPHTHYAECVAMINDVIDNWDATKFTENDNIKLAGL